MAASRSIGEDPCVAPRHRIDESVADRFGAAGPFRDDAGELQSQAPATIR
jgi:hypothetical protein